VYGGTSNIETPAYSIPEMMLKTMVDEQLVALASTRIDSRRYRLTVKGLRLAARSLR